MISTTARLRVRQRPTTGHARRRSARYRWRRRARCDRLGQLQTTRDTDSDAAHEAPMTQRDRLIRHCDVYLHGGGEWGWAGTGSPGGGPALSGGSGVRIASPNGEDRSVPGQQTTDCRRTARGVVTSAAATLAQPRRGASVRFWRRPAFGFLPISHIMSTSVTPYCPAISEIQRGVKHDYVLSVAVERY